MNRAVRRLPALLAFAAMVCLGLPGAAHAATPAVNVAGAPTQGVIAEALTSGAKQVRIFVLWQDFEPAGANQYPAPDRPADTGGQNVKYLSGVFDAAIRQLNAAGAQPIFVVTGAPHWANASGDPYVPPSDPASYAQFFAQFVAHNATVGKVAAYEVWNEADGDGFWHPQPDVVRYTALLKATYEAAKPHAHDSAILAGPLISADYDWLEKMYDLGAKGSFDGLAVHNDGACGNMPPDFFLREADGRLMRWAFLAYREARASMAARGDLKPIWITELGWSSTGGKPNSCTRGTFAGQKPDGVTEADQARFLTQAFGCMAQDPEAVVSAAWFTMRDASGYALNENNHYGLLYSDGTPKPSLAAFKALVAQNGGPPMECGDFTPPTVKVIEPVPGQQFVGRLDVRVVAADGDVGVRRITLSHDDGVRFGFFGQGNGLRDGSPVGLAPWYGSSELPLGPHDIEVVAADKNGNETRVTVPVVKVDPSTVPATIAPAFRFGSRVSCRRRACRVRGGVSRPAGGPPLAGRVNVAWEVLNKKGRWQKMVGGSKVAAKSFVFRLNAKRAGRWRVRVSLDAVAPYLSSASKYLGFRIRR